MVFDMTDQDSLNDVEKRWIKQLDIHLSSTDTPVLLVGNKVRAVTPILLMDFIYAWNACSLV